MHTQPRPHLTFDSGLTSISTYTGHTAGDIGSGSGTVGDGHITMGAPV